MIRADPVRKGLLYAGTETGLYLSFDDGASWSPFQLNLPVSPVHDLLVKGSDLIAGTHGRSIWILDDLTPLRELPADLGAFQLMPARPAERPLVAVDWSTSDPGKNYAGMTGGAWLVTKSPDGETKRKNLDLGDNPPKGAIITYHLAEAPAEPITLTFSDAAGKEIRAFKSKAQPKEGVKVEPSKEPMVPAKAGWNRFIWDLRYAPATKIEGKDPITELSFDGPVVAPGAYSVTLKVGEARSTQTLQVVKDGRVPTSDADLQAQHDLLLRIHRSFDGAVKALNRMRDLRGQLDGWAKRAAGLKGGEGAAEAAGALRDQVLEIEKTLLVPDLRPGWADNLNHGTRLLTKLAALPPVVALGEFRPTDSSEAVYAHLSAQIDEQIGRFNSLVERELPGLNTRIAALELGAVVARP